MFKNILTVMAIALVFSLMGCSRTIVEQSNVNKGAIVKITCKEMVGTAVVVGPHTLLSANHVVKNSKTCTDGDHLLVINHVDPSNDFSVLTSARAYKRAYKINCDGVAPEGDYLLAGFALGQSLLVNQAKGADHFYSSPDTIHLRGMVGETFAGMSGGPVVSSSNEVVGVIVGKMKIPPEHVLVKELKDTSICGTFA